MSTSAALRTSRPTHPLLFNAASVIALVAETSPLSDTLLMATSFVVLMFECGVDAKLCGV